MSEDGNDSCDADVSTDGGRMREAAAPALAGNILPFFAKLFVTREDARKILLEIRRLCEWQDILVIGCVGWMLVPAAELYHRRFTAHRGPFSQTKTYHIVKLVSQMGQIALLVYIIDILDIVRATVGFAVMDGFDLPVTLAKLFYLVWAARKLAGFKHYLLVKYMSDSRQKAGLAHLIDHMLNGMIACVTMFSVVDIFDIEGAGLKSAITFGSAGTLAFTLASQTVVSAIVNGFALSASNRFYVGEFVRFGDGTSGTVMKLGWMETILRSNDDLIVAVPNTQLAGQRVTNLSRNQMCQIHQQLRFHYRNMNDLVPLAETIKSELRKECPELITDGTRQFRVVISDMCETHVELKVDVHFRLPPIGDRYWNNRQKVLLLIHRCVQKHNLQYAVLEYGIFQTVRSPEEQQHDSGD